MAKFGAGSPEAKKIEARLDKIQEARKDLVSAIDKMRKDIRKDLRDARKDEVALGRDERDRREDERELRRDEHRHSGK